MICAAIRLNFSKGVSVGSGTSAYYHTLHLPPIREDDIQERGDAPHAGNHSSKVGCELVPLVIIQALFKRVSRFPQF